MMVSPKAALLRPFCPDLRFRVTFSSCPSAMLLLVLLSLECKALPRHHPPHPGRRLSHLAVRVTFSSFPSAMLRPGYLASVLRLLHTRSNLHDPPTPSSAMTSASNECRQQQHHGVQQQQQQARYHHYHSDHRPAPLPLGVGRALDLL